MFAHNNESTPITGWKKILISILFCIAGVAINFAGSAIVKALNLPLFLDCTGTVIAAIVGGAVPGVAVGYLTNLCNTALDSVSLYYGAVSVLIAVAVAYFHSHGWFEKPHKIALAILILAFVGGGFSSVITSWLFGFGFSGGMSTPLAEWLYSHVFANEFGAQFIADFAYDLVDKSITLGIALLVTRKIPERVSESVDFGIWHQAPLTMKQRRELHAVKPRVMSGRGKIIAVIVLVVVIVGVVTVIISYSTFNDSMRDEQVRKARGIVTLMKRDIDPDRVDVFLEQGESALGYGEVEKKLADIRDSFEGVQYVYVYQIREDGCHVVFDPDTAEEPGSDVGDVIPFDAAFADSLDELLAGKEIEPIVSNESYGWLLSVYEPVYDSSGKCVCYAAVDLLMEHILADGTVFFGKIATLFVSFLILICVVALWLAEYWLVLPISSIALATSGFAFNSEETRADTVEEIQSLAIHTGDEIESLYSAVGKMAQDTANFIEQSTEQAETIERMQDSLIMVMADLVESRDKYTGDHVRKTAAYCYIICEQMMAEGMYPDELTEEFCFDVVHSAPLHDIGKIAVSDSILNKPGRLTQEEFAIMKNHTTAGEEILERAVSAVSEPTYLDEAKNLAKYHHERWDGKGYPTGCAGKDIPLSARIMAVADVFDALVSKRSYKDGMPLEKAFSIIQEGMGTQFDPLVAQAFLDVKDKARAIAEEHGNAAGTQAFDVHDEKLE
ncbi:MAG: HD domain-containing phosphohydrolase [Coriobacteriales bacterium]|nr:HD domain-containing phosphohydrolase [Coriobacteriales bacterium]